MNKRQVNIVKQLQQVVRQGERAGMSRYRLSQVSGVEQAVLSKLVHGTRVPTLHTAEKIVRALGKRMVIVDR
jgi:ribosome-binding protein aMBF1 (putative translation factor)